MHIERLVENLKGDLNVHERKYWKWLLCKYSLKKCTGFS
jgi:hypothetical protein